VSGVTVTLKTSAPTIRRAGSFWSLNYVKDGDIAVSPTALAGSDLWICPGVEMRIFMSNRVVEALKAALSDAELAEFELYRCRVVG
jgi:hypothetical protein